MTQEQYFNQRIVHDAAAYLFWMLADEIGVARAGQAVIDSAGRCLFEKPFTDDVLAQYGFLGLSPNDQTDFLSAIATEAERFAIKGENMDGVIYAEDAQEGRSPSAQHVQTAHLEVIPRRVIVSGAKIEKSGWLCLRHPLPAVVFSEVCPSSDILEVANTSAALGFHLPMFLGNFSTTQFGERLFVSTGIFHIPVPDNSQGNAWGKAIQNSVRFIRGVSFCGEAGIASVDVEW